MLFAFFDLDAAFLSYRSWDSWRTARTSDIEDAFDNHDSLAFLPLKVASWNCFARSNAFWMFSVGQSLWVVEGDCQHNCPALRVEFPTPKVKFISLLLRLAQIPGLEVQVLSGERNGCLGICGVTRCWT